MPEENDGLDILNPEEVVEPESTEVAEPETASEELVKAKEYAANQKIRAEKAEQELKALKKAPTEVAPKNEFTPKDYLALAQANVPAEDFDEVQEYAKFKDVTLADALKTPYIKSHLKEKAEERKTAEAANVGPARRTSSKVSDEVLLEKMDKGELAEEEIEKAVKARIERMKNKT